MRNMMRDGRRVARRRQAQSGGDHAADCLRNLVATKSRVVVQRKLRGLWGKAASGPERLRPGGNWES